MPRGVPTTCEFNRHFVGALLLGFCSLPVPMASLAPPCAQRDRASSRAACETAVRRCLGGCDRAPSGARQRGDHKGRPVGAKLRGVCGSFCSLSPLGGEGSGEGLSARADSRKAKVPFNGAHNRPGTSRKV